MKNKFFRRILIVIIFEVFGIGFFAIFPTNFAVAASETTPFYFDNFDAEYYLSRNSDGNSTLKVREKMTAQFENSGNNNHGIERAIPRIYRFSGDAKTESHSFDLNLTNVFGGNYTTRDDGDNLIVRVGDADEIVRGAKNYGFEYEMTNVTRNFADGDEFYWNANGENWAQSFGEISAKIHVAPEVAQNLDGRAKCDVGGNGFDSGNCEITKLTDENGEIIFLAKSTAQVGANQTLTFDIGFTSGTFAEPPFDFEANFGASLTELIIGGAIFAILLIISIIMLILTLKKYRPAKTGRAIIPQYAPPQNFAISESAVWWQKDSGRGKSLFAAILLNLAVKKFIQIYEIDGKKSEFGIKILQNITANEVSPEELKILDNAFGSLAAGTDVKMKDLQTKTSLGTQIQSSLATIKKSLRETRGFYRAKFPKFYIAMLIILGILAFFISFGFSPLFLFANILPIIFVFFACVLWKPISLAGAEMTDYLAGLKLYMTVAEADRIKFLQSVAGAERIDVNDKNSVVKLYEKLLPFAAIFGISDDWLKVMQIYYADDATISPAWFVGANLAAFNVGSFASAANSAQSYSVSTSSGGSGFSSDGGGFSGGGGGGGGGGGW